MAIGTVADHPYPSLTKNYHYELELVAAVLECAHGWIHRISSAAMTGTRTAMGSIQPERSDGTRVASRASAKANNRSGTPAPSERMVSTCEKLFGPYRWGRYDLLIMPPSAPYGGMENPRLSFITPTAHC